MNLCQSKNLLDGIIRSETIIANNSLDLETEMNVRQNVGQTAGYSIGIAVSFCPTTTKNELNSIP